MRARRLHLVVALAAALPLAGCGGGSDSGGGSGSGSASPLARHSQVLSVAVEPTDLRTPLDGEALPLQLTYTVDYTTDLPDAIYRFSGHLLPRGESLFSPDQTRGRVHVGAACGAFPGSATCPQPYRNLCSYSQAWAPFYGGANRRIVCDPNVNGVTLTAGDYDFVASVCETSATGAGQSSCTSRTTTVTLR